MEGDRDLTGVDDDETTDMTEVNNIDTKVEYEEADDGITEV